MAQTPAPRPAHEAHLTAWHIFLVELLQLFTDSRRVDVRDFVKLGTLPLEADVIFLLKPPGQPALDTPLMRPDLDFLEARLKRLTVVEYKSPTDVLSRRAVDRSRVYGLLAKDRFEVEHDREVAILMLYSRTESGLFDALRDDGLPFEVEQEGICCCRGSLTLYAVDLVALAHKRPRSPLNLISARHREYSQDPSLDPDVLALLDRIQYLIRQRKARGMELDKLQGFDEITQDMGEIRRRFLSRLDPRERLEGLGARERLEGLGARERLEGLGARERLEGLGARERLEGLGARERLEGLDPEQRAELLKLLLQG